jgi:hypothetical protein
MAPALSVWSLVLSPQYQRSRADNPFAVTPAAAATAAVLAGAALGA